MSNIVTSIILIFGVWVTFVTGGVGRVSLYLQGCHASVPKKPLFPKISKHLQVRDRQFSEYSSATTSSNEGVLMDQSLQAGNVFFPRLLWSDTVKAQ